MFAPGCRVCGGFGRVHIFDRNRMATVSRECECWRLVEQGEPTVIVLEGLMTGNTDLEQQFNDVRDQRIARLRKDYP